MYLCPLNSSIVYRSKDYFIEFNKLKSGLNVLDFTLDSDFIKELSGGSFTEPLFVNVTVNLTKRSMMYELDAVLSGTIAVPCDVCLEELKLTISEVAHLIIKLSEFERYDDDAIVYITPQTLTFDLSQFLYDNLIVAVPLKRTCALAGKTCSMQSGPGDEEPDESEKGTTEADPRWDKLKELLPKKKK